MDLNTKLQKEVEQLVERLGNSVIKPLRKKCFTCAASCEQKGSMQQFQQCVSACDAPAQQAEQLLTHELENFNRRLQRCAMDCRDKAQDKMPLDQTKHTPQLIDSLNTEVLQCANTCVDVNFTQLYAIEGRIKAAVNNA